MFHTIQKVSCILLYILESPLCDSFFLVTEYLSQVTKIFQKQNFIIYFQYFQTHNKQDSNTTTKQNQQNQTSTSRLKGRNKPNNPKIKEDKD